MIPASFTALQGQFAALRNRRGFLGRHSKHIMLALLVASVSLINLVWIRQDIRPQPEVDPSAYLIKTVEFVDRLREGGGVHLWQSIVGLHIGGGRAPLYQLLSVPGILLFGRSADAALNVNIIFAAILVLCTYGIGRPVRRPAGRDLPPIVGLSKIYRPDAVWQNEWARRFVS